MSKQELYNFVFKKKLDPLYAKVILMAAAYMLLFVLYSINVSAEEAGEGGAVSLPLQVTTNVHELKVMDITYNTTNDWVQITLKDNDNMMLNSNKDWITGTYSWNWQFSCDEFTNTTVWVSGSNLVLRGYYTDKSKVPSIEVFYGDGDPHVDFLSTGYITNEIQYYSIYEQALLEFAEYTEGGGSVGGGGETGITEITAELLLNKDPEIFTLMSDTYAYCVIIGLDDQTNPSLGHIDTQYDFYWFNDIDNFSMNGTNEVISRLSITGERYLNIRMINSGSLLSYTYDRAYTSGVTIDFDLSYENYVVMSNFDIYNENNELIINESSNDQSAYYMDISKSYYTESENYFRFNATVDSRECENELLVSFSSTVPTQFQYTYTTDYQDYKIYHYKVECASDALGSKDIDIDLKYAGEVKYTETFTINNTKPTLEAEDYYAIRGESYFDLHFVDADIYYEDDTDYVLKITNGITGNFIDPVNPQNEINVYARAILKNGKELIIPVQDFYTDGVIDDMTALYTKLDMTFATHILPPEGMENTPDDDTFYGLDDQIDKVFLRYDMIKNGKVVDADLVILDYATLLEFLVKYDEHSIYAQGFSDGYWSEEIIERDGFFKHEWTLDDNGLRIWPKDVVYKWVDNSSTEGVVSWMEDIYDVENGGELVWVNDNGTITMNPVDYVNAMIGDAIRTGTDGSDYAIPGVDFNNPYVTQTMGFLGDNWLLLGIALGGLYVFTSKGQR